MAQQGFWNLGSWRRRRGDAIVKAAAEWRATFDAIDSPILVLDRDVRVTRLNRAAQMLLGLEFKDLLGRPIGSITPWQPWQATAEIARDAGERGANVSRHVRGDRSKEWHLSASFVPGESREADRIIVLARDVTAVVRLEASLRRVEAMAALGTLVSGVAHEVRNPLFAISATVDALEARASGREELGPFVSTLRSEVDRLSRLMRDLLEYGKPPALELVEADIGQVVAKAVLGFEAHAAERQVAMRSRIEPGLARLRLNPGRIAQVVQNLVDNALQHAPRGTAIELLGAVTSDAPRRVEVSVADRGPGFSPANLPACSSRSSPGGRAAPALASPSSSGSWRTTAAQSRRATGPEAEPS